MITKEPAGVPIPVFHAVSEASLLYWGIGRGAFCVWGKRNGITRWYVNGGKLADLRILSLLTMIGTAASSELTPRDAPFGEYEPWGEVRFVPEDIGLSELTANTWEIGSSGFYIPAPKKLVPADLARDISAVATKSLSMSGPPRFLSVGT